MSRTKKKHPQKSCPVGRKKCWCCQQYFGPKDKHKKKRDDLKSGIDFNSCYGF